MRIRTGLIILGLFLLSSTSNISAQTFETPLTLAFVQAGKDYREGNYKQAIVNYESIIADGFESGQIYYNLANSYFKNNQLGQAILSYERALRLMPRDSDIKFNYQYALSQARVPAQETAMNFFQEAIQGHIQFYTREEMVFIGTGIFFAMGVIFLVSLYGKWSSNVRISIIGVLSLIFLVYVTGFILKIQYEQNLSIILVPSDAKFEPRPNATTHFPLSEGSKVRFIKKQNDWIKIKRMDGKLGWVEKSVVGKI